MATIIGESAVLFSIALNGKSSPPFSLRVAAVLTLLMVILSSFEENCDRPFSIVLCGGCGSTFAMYS